MSEVEIDSFETNTACPVCLNAFVESIDIDTRVLPCQHRIHITCYARWSLANNTCPICRAIVTPGLPAVNPAGVELNMEAEIMASQVAQMRENAIRRAVSRLERALTDDELAMDISDINSIRKRRRIVRLVPGTGGSGLEDQRSDQQPSLRSPRSVIKKVVLSKKDKIKKILETVGLNVEFVDNHDLEQLYAFKTLYNFLNDMITQNSETFRIKNGGVSSVSTSTASEDITVTSSRSMPVPFLLDSRTFKPLERPV